MQMNSSNAVSIGARNLYKLGYLYGFFSAAVLYVILSKVFVPRQAMVKGTSDIEIIEKDQAHA